MSSDHDAAESGDKPVTHPSGAPRTEHPPPPAPPNKIDPGEHQRALIHQARLALRQAFAFSPIALYFWGYWPVKEYARRALRVGAVSVLFLSLLLLTIEVVGELVGSDRLAHGILEPKSEIQKMARHVAFILAVTYLFWDHWREFNHQRSRDMIGGEVWQMLESRATDDLSFLERALPLVEAAFSKFHAQRVCVWLPDEAELKTTNAAISGKKSERLQDIVASATYRQQLMHYVPRFGFPFTCKALACASLDFPHALSFETGHNEKFQPFVHKGNLSTYVGPLETSWREDSLRAFLMVPLKTSERDCYGVLTVEFARNDPIDSDQMKVAASFAILIAEELRRQKGQSRGH